MTDTPNDPANQPEPEGLSESADQNVPAKEPTAEEFHSAQASQPVVPASDGATPTAQTPVTSATSAPTSPAPAASQPAPPAAYQPPAAPQTWTPPQMTPGAPIRPHDAAMPPAPQHQAPQPIQPTQAAPNSQAQPVQNAQPAPQQQYGQAAGYGAQYGQPGYSQQPTAAQPTVGQPTAQQPTAPQQPAHQQSYGAGAFGQPAQAGAQNPYAPYTAQPTYAGQNTTQQGYGTQATQPLTAAAADGAAKKESTKRRNPGLIVAAIAVAALLGGAGGAGVMGIYASNHSNTATPTSNNGVGNITVNNAKDATVVTAVAAKATPSVVTINVSDSSGNEAGTGSGVVLSADGYVLTNTHVVTLDGDINDPDIQVQDNNGKLYTAKVVGMDPLVDLAVIKLNNASGMTPMAFADSSKLNVGDQAVAIGAPLGLAGTVTDGIVSALNRSIQIASSAAPSQSDGSQNGDNGDGSSPFNFDLPGQGQQQTQTNTISLPVIQTDAAINPGNSGGALLNNKGELIGVNVAIASASQSSDGSQTGNIGVGFAIPSNLAQRIANELMKDGKATNGLLGATVKDVTSGNTVGAVIDSTTPGGAADKAGLKAGDVVTNFNGIPITNPTDLTAQVRALAGGATAKITYVRDGQALTSSVTLGTATQ